MSVRLAHGSLGQPVARAGGCLAIGYFSLAHLYVELQWCGGQCVFSLAGNAAAGAWLRPAGLQSAGFHRPYQRPVCHRLAFVYSPSGTVATVSGFVNFCRGTGYHQRYNQPIFIDPCGKQNAVTNAVPSSLISSSDRLGMTLFFALAFHAILILGVSFDLADDDFMPPLTTMEITLVHNRSDEAPEDADYLAQSNQLGGGNVEEKTRDQSPFSNPSPTQDDGFAPASEQAIVPAARQPEQVQQEIMTANQATEKTLSKPLKDPLPDLAQPLTAAQLLERSRQKIARMSAEIKRMKKTFQVTPRRTYVRGANAREYRFASYLDAWRAKVERFGNLNYPEEALRQKIDGSLLLDVAINPDGSINHMKVIQSSGHKVLDDAAQRIVRLAAPFPPLSKEILKDTDVLHIPRVWYFKSGSGLSTGIQ